MQIGQHRIHLKEVTSSNDYLKNLIQKKKALNGLIVTTDFQSKGRGYHMNSWESDNAKNLLLSFFVEFDNLPAENQFQISQFVCLAIQRFCSRYADGFVVKWPNDVYHQKKKIAGVLIENQVAGNKILSTMAGIGLNLNQVEFQSNAPNPISLQSVIGHETDREIALQELLEDLNFMLAFSLSQSADQLTKMYLGNLYRFQEWGDYQAEGLNFRAKLIGVNKYGMVQLQKEDSTIHEFGFKEVIFMD